MFLTMFVNQVNVLECTQKMHQEAKADLKTYIEAKVVKDKIKFIIFVI
jgi:hypothetical protein